MVDCFKSRCIRVVSFRCSEKPMDVKGTLVQLLDHQTVIFV